MPRIIANRVIVTPETVAAVNLIRARIRELRALNGEATEVTQGHVVGLVEAEAYILESLCDRATDPTAPL